MISSPCFIDDSVYYVLIPPFIVLLWIPFFGQGQGQGRSLSTFSCNCPGHSGVANTLIVKLETLFAVEGRTQLVSGRASLHLLPQRTLGAFFPCDPACALGGLRMSGRPCSPRTSGGKDGIDVRQPCATCVGRVGTGGCHLSASA
jgi:hypothetical protein